MLPYENSTSGDRALLEIQKLLHGFGCTKFGSMIDWEKGELIVQFEWRGRKIHLPASIRGYKAAWLKAHPYSYRSKCSRQKYEEKAEMIASTAVYSILRDWIKGQFTAVECGLMTFEAVFLPHMLLPDGRRVVEGAQDLLSLPPPTEGHVSAQESVTTRQ